MAEGGTNEAPKKISANITYSAPSSAPKYGTPGAANVLTTSALLLAEIEQSGADSNTIDFVWDTSDKGTSNISDWNGSALAVGTGKEGFYGKQVSGLNINTTYYYRNRTAMSVGPLDIAGAGDLKLWLDASALTTAGSTWTDKSGKGNHATKVRSPVVETDVQNGLSVMRYSGGRHTYHYWPTMTDIRTVFWVVSKTTDTTQERFLLGDRRTTQTFHFFANGNTIFHNTSASVNVRGSGARLVMNGTDIGAGTSSSFPTSLGIISLQTGGNVTANSFSKDRQYRDRTWKGDLGELIIFNTRLTDQQTESINGYLAHKWGLSSNLPGSHTYKSAPPSFIAWSDVQSFTTETSITAPVLGAQSVANLDTTSADLEVVLTDNGNDATTITFYYGTTDGGTTPVSWDSNVSFSNALEATIRKSVTGLTSGQTYYFRTFAKNSSSQNNGEDWANSSTAFTTVTSSVREDTEAVRYSDLEGWWKLDGNLNDSSGNNRNASPTWMPEDLEIWMDADNDSSFSVSTGSISSWSNLAGATYTFNQKEGDPKRISGGPNGRYVVEFGGSPDVLWTNDAYNSLNFTILAVSRQNGGTNRRLIASKSVNWLFGYHQGTKNDFFLNGWVHNASTASDSAWHIHVATVNSSDQANAWADFTQLATNSTGGSDTYPGPGKLSFGGVYSSNNSEHSSGEVAELLLFDRVLSESERQLIEGYLANKWNLSIPSSHAFSTWPHSSINEAFSQDSANGTGKSLDLSNGVSAIVQTGGTEDVFDGGSAFSTSLWVKGWPSTAGEAIIGKDHFDPGAFGSLKAWLDASNPDYLSKSGATNPPSAGENFLKWYDLSGNNHHASTESGSPSWESSLINSNPGVKLDGSTLVLDNSAVAFDEWSELHVFAVLRIHANTTWKRVFGKTSSASSSANTAWSYSIRRGDFSPPTYFARVRNNSNADFNRESGNSRTTSLHDSPGGLFTMSWGGGSFTNRIDGTQNSTVSSTGTIGSLSSEPVKIGQGFGLYFGEFLIFDEKLSSADEQKIEGYLAHKWGFAGDLPSSGHSGKSAAPTAGWGIKRAASGNDNLTLNMVGAGGELTKAVAVNDNDWHHVVTTYGGGNKKIYIDGVEKATAAQTGSVTASSAKLTMGDFIPFGNITGPKIDDVRIYGAALTRSRSRRDLQRGRKRCRGPKILRHQSVHHARCSGQERFLPDHHRCCLWDDGVQLRHYLHSA